ncbi:MAG: UvrB/UvrC motif-containing protein, partial [Clostridia bacterium]
LYGDQLTQSMERAINETNRRRALQEAYNRLHGITPQSVTSTVQALLKITQSMAKSKPEGMSEEELQALLQSVEDQMLSAAKALDFEKAAKLRDELFHLRGDQKEEIQKPQAWRKRNKKFK